MRPVWEKVEDERWRLVFEDGRVVEVSRAGHPFRAVLRAPNGDVLRIRAYYTSAHHARQAAVKWATEQP